MTKKTKQQPAEQTAGKNPDFIAYTVIHRGGDANAKGFWREIGTAWTHNDGNGIQIRLEALPLDGVVTLRMPLPPRNDA